MGAVKTGARIRLSVASLLVAVLVVMLVARALQWSGDGLGPARLAHQTIANQTESMALSAELLDLKLRWRGAPAVWQPPPIDDTEFIFYEVTGQTQSELSSSLKASKVCERFGPCLPDPASAGGTTLGLEGQTASSWPDICYSPQTWTPSFTYHIVLPRWVPPSDGTVKIHVVEVWNSLLQAIFAHESGHVAIAKSDIGDLIAQSHGLATCRQLDALWGPGVWDKLEADQNAYHARLRANCQPAMGCVYAGWNGWYI